MCVILLWCESEKVCSNPALDCYIAKLFELKSLSDKMIKKKKKTSSAPLFNGFQMLVCDPKVGHGEKGVKYQRWFNFSRFLEI